MLKFLLHVFSNSSNFRPFSNKIIMLPYGHFEIIGLVLCGDLQVIIVYFNTKKNVLKIPNYRT